MKKRVTKQLPSQLLQDNDGHWYLVPEDKIVMFESAIEMIDNELDSDDGCKALGKLSKYQIDRPEMLRILAWEEMT